MSETTEAKAKAAKGRCRRFAIGVTSAPTMAQAIKAPRAALAPEPNANQRQAWANMPIRTGMGSDRHGMEKKAPYAATASPAAATSSPSGVGATGPGIGRLCRATDSPAMSPTQMSRVSSIAKPKRACPSAMRKWAKSSAALRRWGPGISTMHGQSATRYAFAAGAKLRVRAAPRPANSPAHKI